MRFDQAAFNQAALEFVQDCYPGRHPTAGVSRNDAPSTAPSGPSSEQAGLGQLGAAQSKGVCDIGQHRRLANELIELHVEPVVTVDATLRRGAERWP